MESGQNEHEFKQYIPLTNMKKTTLGLIHTSATMVPIFKELCQEKLPEIETFDLVDGSLIRDVIRAGKLTESVAQRVAMMIFQAEKAGADQILVTCSSIGRAVETAGSLCAVPVLRVDFPLANRAVQIGQTIGVIATLKTTMDPTTDLVNRRADVAGKAIRTIPRLCEGAFEALMSGDSERHDRMVAEALRELAEEVDVILLAQASMARVVARFKPGEIRVPVLGSPPIAIEYLANELNKVYQR
jgi:Asp/Glu/hydantoin racemase